MGFSKQEYWSRLPFPSPGDLPHPGIEPASPALAGRFFTAEPPGNPGLVGTLLKSKFPDPRQGLALQVVLSKEQSQVCYNDLLLFN